MEVLLECDWHACREKHERRVRRWIEPRLARASRNEPHPVEDFLFEYYAYRPAKLLGWHPGIGITLQGETARQYLSHKNYGQTAEGLTADASTLPPQRIESIRWCLEMLRRTNERSGAFGCFGLHEWAMVYGAETVRHAAWPLRVTPGEIARLVESIGPRCTHYDAFRFFTPAARPLNKHQPTRATTGALEQPGCLHANMDLYKWAFKLAPFTASELVADCFELALNIRVLDMRASPYDFTMLGYQPVPIERPEGRAEYEALQREFAICAAPLRERLIKVCDQVIEQAGSGDQAGLASR
ncbi:MAG TPA: hypothetical protein VIS96_13945 [Terrimicrobiaceae bacterium]